MTRARYGIRAEKPATDPNGRANISLCAAPCFGTRPEGFGKIRSDTVFKLAFNRALEQLSSSPDLVLTENALARLLNISRTTSRKVLARLQDSGITCVTDRQVRLNRRPTASDRYPQVDTLPGSQHVERKFMEWIFHAETRPGTLINEADLSRQFGSAPGTLREYLIGFSRYGLIEKKPNSDWLFHGFTKDFALDLFEVRTLFELRSVRYFVDLPQASPLWTDLQVVRAEHLAIAEAPETRLRDFCALDDRFHRLLAACAPNRFITDFHGIIALIFHYHYQWNRRTELARCLVATREHLAIIDALQARDLRRAEATAMAHLDTSRASLLHALGVGPRIQTTPLATVRAAR